ncbi:MULTISPECIES: sugar-binding transcriptional regulator [Lichenihabitans]|uniref:sugar-binding transcriptional regulator n=1 Tax=Lichenihabitans TaxID=2723776 RepID=UPI0010358E95|nr:MULTISPECIES: sugar-binding transcriptional regulator [Lichenihabitans]UDL94106.1 sugar-binding transcriptional regulator [Lichenihabitans sp. PAMC28606]
MNDKPIDAKAKRLDLAARAGWLYYIQRRTQDEIAIELNVSRANAQRLVALAISEGLIKFRLDHPLLQSMELAERIRHRFGLQSCEIAPSVEGDGDNRLGVGMVAAKLLEGYLSSRDPKVIALGTGRALLETVRQMPSMSRPEHRIVSVVGNLSRDGRASPYDVAMRLSDRVGAECYPLPLPVITDTQAECDILRSQRGYRKVADLYENADAVMLGVGSIGGRAPILVDGFVNRDEIDALLDDGAVGELMSRSFDGAGVPIDNAVTARLTALRLIANPQRIVVLVASGADKVRPMMAALEGRYATGLVTDERTATALLAQAGSDLA